MKKISFISLFTDFFVSFKEHSIIKRAIDKKIIEIEIIDIRDFSTNNKVDDYVYGGGAGMLMLIEPVVKAIESIKTNNSYVVFLDPQGNKFDQNKAKQLSKDVEHLILISGHYEGIDSRIKYFIDEKISVGNFILTGGEIPSILIADAIIRLIPNVINNESIEVESFNNNRIEYDQFSKPRDFRGYKVPEDLLKGNHQKSEQWREQSSLKNTINYLYKNTKK